MLKLDIRTKLLLLIIANILMFKKMSIYEHLFSATIFTLLILVIVSWKRAIRIYSVYLFFTLYELFLAKYTSISIIDNFMVLSALMFKTIYFPICSGIILVGSSKVSELITFLRSVKIPSSIIVVLAVIFRFFPAMLTDYKYIKNSLKMKGIGISKLYYLRHPLKFIEYVFVPYVIISSNIANDLTISSICRGIESDRKKSSIQTLKFTLSDYIFLLFIVLFVYFIGVKN